MPELSRFYGIVIKMYYNDHNPPHFHAEYGSQTSPFIWTTLFHILAVEKLLRKTFGHFVKTAIGAKATIHNWILRANNTSGLETRAAEL